MTLALADYGDLIEARYCLSEIPDFQGLLPKSSDVGVPVFEIQDNEIHETGPVLAGFKTRRDSFRAQFQSIADKLVALLSHA
jgi:hypothetical protein